MEKCEFQNAIRVNHRGFLKKSQKRFILTENKTESETFSVFLIDDVKEIKVFDGKMTSFCENGRTFYEGDFSSVTDNGDYFIVAGGVRSRQFVIYDGAYDICNRIMLEYFTYQRCGHLLGWNGKCHTDDGYIKETGERVDLSGGYHQSCDLRKSPGGVSIGVLGMLRFALKDKSEWGNILVADEARWALEYFIKTIQENGVMYNTLNSPFGWEGREFYKSGAPSSAQWNTTSILTLGYMYFKNKDEKFAQRCLEKALLSYDYMMSDNRPNEVYKHPEKYPFGMDPDAFYEQCRPNSTSDLAYQITASADLYRATGEEKYIENIKNCLPRVQNSLKNGFVLTRQDDKEKTVSASCSYCWLMSGLLSLLDAYEILGDFCGLEEKLTLALDSACDFADKSVWRTFEKLYSDADLSIVDGHLNMTRKDSIGDLVAYKDFYYSQSEVFEPSYACYMGIFLARGSKLLANDKYMRYAQFVVDNLLGANVLDSSHIRSIGYNNPQHHAYGQFFPSTPFIPGAVGVGYKTIDVYKNSSEYDMPCVGISMYLLSEIS